MASRKEALARRANRVRRQLKAVANGRPRLSVHRSSKNIYAQVIDDATGTTLVHASTLSKDLQAGGAEAPKVKKSDQAKRVGALVAKMCLSKKIDHVVFDRNGYKYHGRISALAKAARDAGLKF